MSLPTLRNSNVSLASRTLVPFLRMDTVTSPLRTGKTAISIRIREMSYCLVTSGITRVCNRHS